MRETRRCRTLIVALGREPSGELALIRDSTGRLAPLRYKVDGIERPRHAGGGTGQSRQPTTTSPATIRHVLGNNVIDDAAGFDSR